LASATNYLASGSKWKRGGNNCSGSSKSLENAMADGKVIAVIDDDGVMREALDQLLVSFGFQAELYGSAEAFVEAAMKSQARSRKTANGLPAIAAMTRSFKAVHPDTAGLPHCPLTSSPTLSTFVFANSRRF
jgi:DNA-binding NtrC family response regulator